MRMKILKKPTAPELADQVLGHFREYPPHYSAGKRALLKKLELLDDGRLDRVLDILVSTGEMRKDSLGMYSVVV